MKCPTCSASLARNATFCSSCGTQVAPRRTGRSGLQVLAIVIGLLALMAVMQKGQTSPQTMPAAQPSVHGSTSQAMVQCRGHVRDRLRAPATAQFSGFNETNAQEVSTDLFRVTGYVDAENSFGANIRTTYQCTVQYEGSTYRLVDMTVSP